jgi:hypothetical protein
MDRFAELHDQRTTAETQLTALTTTQPVAADPAMPSPSAVGPLTQSSTAS